MSFKNVGCKYIACHIERVIVFCARSQSRILLGRIRLDMNLSY